MILKLGIVPNLIGDFYEKLFKTKGRNNQSS